MEASQGMSVTFHRAFDVCRNPRKAIEDIIELVDSLTFMFDGGISMQNTNFSDGVVKMNAKNSSFDYITMQFRLSKKGAMSIGLLPYSNVGYKMGNYQENTETPTSSASTTYSGEGGLHQLYIGAGFKIIKNLSVGANISYLWGDRKSTRLNSSHIQKSRMPSSA